MRSQWLLLCLVAYLLFQTGNFCALSFYGSWLAKSFGLGSVGTGLVMGAGSVVCLGVVLTRVPQDK